MALPTFSLTVLSAEDQLYAGDVVSVTLPTEAGEVTLLPSHVPLVASLHAGELVIRTNDGEMLLFVGGGAVEFSADNVCRVLADVAERAEDIDEAAAEAARTRAQKTIEEAASEPDVAAAQAALLHAIARLRIAERHRKLRR